MANVVPCSTHLPAPAGSGESQTTQGFHAVGHPPPGLYHPSTRRTPAASPSSQLSGEKSHSVVEHAITALENLGHRGASGSEPDSGDGAGILTQVPDEFFRAVLAEQGHHPAAVAHYAVGIAFLPDDDAAGGRR